MKTLLLFLTLGAMAQDAPPLPPLTNITMTLPAVVGVGGIAAPANPGTTRHHKGIYVSPGTHYYSTVCPKCNVERRMKAMKDRRTGAFMERGAGGNSVYENGVKVADLQDRVIHFRCPDCKFEFDAQNKVLVLPLPNAVEILPPPETKQKRGFKLPRELAAAFRPAAVSRGVKIAGQARAPKDRDAFQ